MTLLQSELDTAFSADRSENDQVFDLLAVEAYAWSPNLETSCEICLVEAEGGRKVGFAFLDFVNLDEYRDWGFLALPVAQLLRAYRRNKVNAIARILRSRGVKVLLIHDRDLQSLSLTCQQAQIHSIDQLREFRLDGAKIGVGVLSSVISFCKCLSPNLQKNRRLTDSLLTAAFRTFRVTNQLIDTYQPATILLFNGRLAHAKAIDEAARLKGIKVMYHEVGATKERYYLSDEISHSASNSRKRLQDTWRNGGPDREAIGAAYFAPGRSGLSILEARHDNGQRRNKVLPPTGRRRVAFFASSVDEYAAVESAYDEFLFVTQRAAVEWLVNWVRARPDTELILRLHPRMRNLSASERKWWMDFSHGNVLTVPGEHPLDSYALAASSEKVVNFHSSLGPEATYLGRVSILVGDAMYRGLDCVYEPTSTEELQRLLEDPAVPPKPAVNCLPYGFNRVMSGTPYRFYQPGTFSDGTFFGVAYPPLPTRIEMRLRKKIAKIKGTIDRFLSKRCVAHWS